MVVRKILEATIASGGTTATFTDADIPNSLIRVYSTNSNIYPQNISLAGNVLTVTYEAVTSSMGVAVEIVKQGLEIVDALNSDDADKALSAKQGYVLKGLIDNIVIPTVPENITDLDDVDVNDIEDGQILAWDEVSEKFINVNQSGGGTVDYTTDEKLVGTYLGKNLYTRTFVGVPTSTGSTPYLTNITTRTASGIGSIVFAGGYLLHTDGNSLVIPCYVNTGNTGGVYTSALGDIRLYNTGVYTKYYLTLWYIKEVI